MSNRGFSLIETMVAAGVLGVIGASLLMTMSFSSTEIANNRVRAVAAADAQAQVDRMIIMAGVALTDAQRCTLYTAAGGPMDATTGGTTTGTCPTVNGNSMTVANIPIPASTLRRQVRITAQDIGNRPGLLVELTVNGPQLSAPIVVTTQIKR